MTGTHKYAVLGLSDSRRNERLNAGLIVFGDSHVDLRLPKRLDRLRALSAALDLDIVRESLQNIPAIDAFARQEGMKLAQDRIQYISQITNIEFSTLGNFEAHNTDAYEVALTRLQKLLIDPEPAPSRTPLKRTKLTTSVKSALRQERILARKGEDLTAHRVVSNVQIAEGLLADFVLKNGAMHVFETVDASSEDIALRRVVSDIAVSALVLEQARMTFGQDNTKSRLIYDASVTVERHATPSLMAAQHQGAELINWASADDRRALIVELTKLADRLPTKGEARTAVNASTQHKFTLN